jgi:hypothetical protein
MSNFDKTGYPIGVTTGEYIIVPTDCKAVYQADPGNRELVMSVETLNYSSKKVLSIIIFQGIYYLRKHFDNNIDSNILFAQSSTGYSNNKLGLVYLKYFNRFTELSTKGKYCILIFDSYRSYIIQLFIDYCWEYQIQPFLLPAHNIYLLQPLDVGVFQTIKSNFKKVVQCNVQVRWVLT